MLQNPIIKTTEQDGVIILDIYDSEVHVIHQPFNPVTGNPMLSEEEAQQVAELILAPVPTKPSYEQLEQELEATQNELLIAKGVI